MIAPNAEVWLGHVPWDTSYRHVYYEGYKDKSRMVSEFMTKHTTNYHFISEDTAIKVPYNADDIYDINYCMYRNGTTFWYCCFVVKIEYISNSTSKLYLQEDIWHTWGENLVVKKCMIDRQHVTSDNYGEWRTPEPNFNLETDILTEQKFNFLTFDAVIIGTNAIPHMKDGTGSIFAAHDESALDGSESVRGGFYGPLYSGLKYYGFTSNERDALNNFIDNLNKAGAAESIACFFMVPSLLMQTNALHEVTSYSNFGREYTFQGSTVSAMGYIPRNKKCLTYPYCYFVVTDYNGSKMELKYEDCQQWGNIGLTFEQGLDSTAQLYVTATDYQHVAINYQYSMMLSQNPQCAWAYSAYQNWAAQNASALHYKNVMTVGAIVGGIAMTAAGIGLMASGVGAPAGAGLLASVGPAALAGQGASMALGGATGAIQNAIDIDVAKKQPDHISGTSSSNSLKAINREMGGYMRMGLQLESAKRLDSFFDVFGYKIDMVATPNLEGRPAYNYVKTVGAAMQGAIPADKLKVINDCFDRGITFWHTNDVGNYNLNNQLQ